MAHTREGLAKYPESVIVKMGKIMVICRQVVEERVYILLWANRVLIA